MHPSWIEIDLKQFKRNILVLKHIVGSAKLCLPVKANAYGHGLCSIAQAAIEAGVDYLAVAHLNEAIKLREYHSTMPILVLGAIHEEQITDLLNYNLEFTLSSSYKAQMVENVCQALKKRCRVHIEVDTGMRRTGMRPKTAADLFSSLKHSEHIEVVGVYSHLANASHPHDQVAKDQIKTFRNLISSPPFSGHQLICHLANSSGILHFPDAYFDMVRPALISFGYIPSEVKDEFKALRPCFSVKAKVSYFKIVEKDEGISYGHSFIAKKRTRIVTIPVGYGDGFRRELSNRGSVLIKGSRYPIVGTICMDQFMVDVGDDSVYVGDEVVLIGRQGEQEITIQEVADLCHSIPYEVLCLFNERIPRVYL